MNIYLIRHGETDYNRQMIVQGSGVNSSLNDTGRLQAEAFYTAYKTISFDVVLTSGLKRTHETVNQFIEDGIKWEQFSDINEIGWGVHEGKKGREGMRADYARVTNAWKNGDYTARVEEGESAVEMKERLQRFVDQLKQRKEETILICSHGRAMRALVCVMMNEPLSEMDKYKHANTGLYQFEFDGQAFSLVKENSTDHLGEIETVKWH